MSYSPQQVEDLYKNIIESSKNILPGRTSGGSVGETLFVALNKPHRGQTSLNGVAIHDCPPGECLALSDGIAWYVVSNNSAIAQNKTIIRSRRTRPVEEEELLKRKMAVLYTSRTDETQECTCPKFTYTEGNCEERCQGGDYATLEECQERSEVWSVYMSVGKHHWHRHPFSHVLSDPTREKPIYDLFPRNQSNERDEVDTGAVLFDRYPLPLRGFPQETVVDAGGFLYDLGGTQPDFAMYVSFVGNLTWRGQQDLELVNYSGIDFVTVPGNDPYEPYKGTNLLQLYSYGFYIYSGSEDLEYPSGVFRPRAFSLALGAGSPGVNFGILAMTAPKNVTKALEFFNASLGDRFDGGSLRIDYVLDRNRKVVEDYRNNIPPPPPHKRIKGKLYFLLGGDKSKPTKLPFTLSEQETYLAHLSVVDGQKIVTVKHGTEERFDQNRWCKITTLTVADKDKVEKITTTYPGPVTPVEKEWRSHELYNFNLGAVYPFLEPFKCSYYYWNARNVNVASLLKLYPWDGEKAKLYEFFPSRDYQLFVLDIILKNLKVPHAIYSAKWDSKQNYCALRYEKSKEKVNVFRLLTHENQETTWQSRLIGVLGYAIYDS
jgi:hypothetical protein